jgi:prephenate dehydrogenase
MKIGMIGLGLMGASFAEVWCKQHIIIGYDQDKQVMDKATRDQLIHVAVDSIDEIIAQSEILWINLYPQATKRLIEQYQAQFPKDYIVCDIAGVKSLYQDMTLRKDVYYIWTHPIAGRAISGYDAKNTSMFQGANFILTPNSTTSQEAISIVTALVKECGFSSITTMTPKEHDDRIAYTSQLTHAIAVALMNSAEDDLGFAPIIGDSYRDLTRIARINEAMWSELFVLNQAALLSQMKLFHQQFTYLMNALEQDDQETIRLLMRQSREKREKLL